MVECSVVIATYGRDKVLFDTINSLLKSTQVEFELIVVDQNKKVPQHYESQVRLLSAQKNVTWVKSEEPSLTKARNVGCQIANSDIVIYVDDDVLVDPLYIENYAKAFKAHPEVDAVVGPIYDEKGNEASSRKYHDRLSKAIRLPLIAKLPNGGYTVAGGGGNMGFRRYVLEELNGFNERFIGNAVREESEMFMRLNKAGKKVWFDPSCGLIHLAHDVGGCSSRAKKSLKAYAQFFYAYYYNHLIFVNSVVDSKREWLKYVLGTLCLCSYCCNNRILGAVRWCIHALLLLSALMVIVTDGKRPYVSNCM